MIINYIQWLFPLQERSMFNLYTPILDESMIAEFRNNSGFHINSKNR
jgi:hypothetical protein